MPSKYFQIGGGLDLSTPELEVSPSRISGSLNYFDSIEGGYQRGGAIEVFDGKLSPSDNIYHVATFDNWNSKVTDILADTDITVGTITMHVLEVDLTVDDELTAIVCSLAGTIPTDIDETPIDWDGASSLVYLVPEGADTDAEHETHVEAAWTYARSLIGEVAGDDDYVKGCLSINDTVVAFRNTGTVPKVFYSSPTGWIEGRIGRVVEVTGITAGTTVAGETFDSGNFIITAATEWYDSDAVPSTTKAWFVITPTTALDEPATGAQTASGGEDFTIASVIQPIQAFGEYIQYENFNFLSHPEEMSAYLCDGVNLPMTYSPLHKTLLPIAPNFNDYSGDKATRVRVRGESLIYADGEGTFQVSEHGLPLNFSGLYGASEQGVGGLVTDMEMADNEQMIVFTNIAARKLIGNDSSNFTFPPAAGNLGSLFGASQKLDDIFTLSSRGVSSLRRTDTEGGYESGSISQNIRQLTKTLPSRFSCSVALAGQEQIRWYFTDSRFLVMTRRPIKDGYSFGFTEGSYPNIPIRGVCCEVWSDGVERTFGVSTTGFVYELEKGTNVNGEEIYSYLSLHNNHLGTPARNKSFKKVFFNTAAQNPASLVLDFAVNGGQKSFNTRNIEATVKAATFDEAEFGTGSFSTADNPRSSSTLKGKGYDIGFSIEHSSKFSKPYNITGYTLKWNDLGMAVE
jgi:hypothetical protein